MVLGHSIVYRWAGLKVGEAHGDEGTWTFALRSTPIGPCEAVAVAYGLILFAHANLPAELRVFLEPALDRARTAAIKIATTGRLEEEVAALSPF
jgi:hypothetical protein